MQATTNSVEFWELAIPLNTLGAHDEMSDRESGLDTSCAKEKGVNTLSSIYPKHEGTQALM